MMSAYNLCHLVLIVFVVRGNLVLNANAALSSFHTMVQHRQKVWNRQQQLTSFAGARDQQQPPRSFGVKSLSKYGSTIFFAKSSIGGDNEEEIAKLEEQLRKLREDDNDSTTTTKTVKESLTTEEKRIYDTLEKMQGKEMLLSERELLRDGLVTTDGDGGGISIPAILAGVALLVGVGLFSQIPVGQDGLAQYSASGSSGVNRIDLGDINPDRTKE